MVISRISGEAVWSLPRASRQNSPLHIDGLDLKVVEHDPRVVILSDYLFYDQGLCMSRVAWLCGMAVIVCTLSGCMDRDTGQVSGNKAVGKIEINATKSGELALKFLQGSQKGDKSMMYGACNLTDALVEESREKLIHQTQTKLSDPQRRGHEEILRISGQVDYFNGKLRKMFPKTSGMQISGSTSLSTVAGASRFDHMVTVTYNDRNDALTDKTGRGVKIMTLHLLQQTSYVGGRQIHSFSFDAKGFERFADKDFDVTEYF